MCENCIAETAKKKEIERREELARLSNTIKEQFTFEPKDIDLHSLTLGEAVFLLAFIRATAAEDLSRFGPLESCSTPLSPSIDFTVSFIRELCSQKLIRLHPQTPATTVTFEDDHFQYDLTKVWYALSVGQDKESIRQFITKLENTFKHKELWPIKWQDQVLALWRSVSLQECLQYLYYVLREHNLPFSAGEKTHIVLHSLLEQYSVAQVHTIIWSSGMRAAAFYQRGGVTKHHAANTVVSAMQNYGERARVEGWAIKQARRDFNCPQSVISHVLFNTVLQIGERGFNETPHSL